MGSGSNPKSQENLKPFKPGQSGNPKGRAKGKTLRQLLRDVAESKKRKLIEAMYKKALRGDPKAAEWVAKHSQEGSGSATIETKDFTVTLAPPTDPDDEEEA
ncbi:hypothetical protein LCGC14_1479970 [marine sediment metagenome]|uniref:DUF5681 domain-containing protein n=1 Tax=marine sediment metagenome TaxID=412755 RepID=A0A0F9J9S8_9ZZZZ